MTDGCQTETYTTLHDVFFSLSFFYIPNRFDRKDRSVYDVQEERQVNNLYTGTRAAACEGGCPPASFFHA